MLDTVNLPSSLHSSSVKIVTAVELDSCRTSTVTLQNSMLTYSSPIVTSIEQSR